MNIQFQIMKEIWLLVGVATLIPISTPNLSHDKGIFVDGKQMEKDNDEIYSFEFEDQIIETPKTGDNNSTIIVLSIVLICSKHTMLSFSNIPLHNFT